MSLSRPNLSLFAALALLAACSASPSNTTISVSVAPLSLPGVERACYDLRVTNSTNGEGDTVWSRGTPGVTPDADAICSDRYGQQGDITYVGTCDASGQVDGDAANERINSVTLWVDALYDANGAIPEDGDNGWQDPCPSGCTLDVLCSENADTLVSFDLTILRQANQGFFDIAVTFEDIFCSAKVDCRYDGGDPIELLFHPDTGVRDTTVVVALACTAGPSDSIRTILFRDPLVVTCGDTPIPLTPALDNGNAFTISNPDPDPNDAVWQYAIYAGDEALDCGGSSCGKTYWNVAIGLDTTVDNCTLRTRMSAAPEGEFTGLTTPPGTTWPFIDVVVPLTNTAGLVCDQNPLNGQNSGVVTRYTSLQTPLTFASSYSSLAINECARGSDDCDTNATCTDTADGFTCACNAGFTGDGRSCADIDECGNNTDNCSPNANCTNLAGSFGCACAGGFAGNGTTCTDIDECTANTDNCSPNATCTNTIGSFGCVCSSGFSGNGVTCVDIDECDAGSDTCHANAACTNTPGGYTCACLPGYSGDGFSCADLAAPGFILAAGLTDPTHIDAVTILVDDLRDAGLWEKLIAVYPMVGGTAQAHKFNLIDPRDTNDAYRLTFNGAWTHSATGAKPDGSTAWASTHLVPSTVLDNTTFESFGYYARTDSAPAAEFVMGSSDNSGNRSTSLWTRRSGAGATAISMFAGTSFNQASQASSADGRGFYIATQQGGALKLFGQGSLIAQDTTAGSGSPSTSPVALGATNNSGTYANHTSKECTFAFVGRSLTDTDVAALQLAVQRFETTLARQVGPPSYTETVLDATPVSTGLIVHLDASDTSSYSGSGTTWTDLSGNNHHFTLFNGPTHVPNESIQFDGVNDYARSTNTINLSGYDYIAVDITLRTNTTVNVMAFEHTPDWNTNAGSFGLALNSNGVANQPNLHHTVASLSNTVRNYDAVINTGWSQHVNLYARIADATGRLTWVNGLRVPFNGAIYADTTGTTGGFVFANAHFYLGSRGGGSAFLNGRISSVKVYGIKLNNSDVLRNFNAARVPVNL